MSTSDYYAEIGLKAAKRAARKVAERANLEQRAIPFWKNGKVVHEIPPLFDPNSDNVAGQPNTAPDPGK